MYAYPSSSMNSLLICKTVIARQWTALLLTLLLSATAANAIPRSADAITLEVPSSPVGASVNQTGSFSSLSFEPAFWEEFFGNYTNPNTLTFALLQQLVDRGNRPIIRPGGITMDSMIFDINGGNPVRTSSPDGGVYYTTVGPAYFWSWGNFPPECQFISTLNLHNDSVDISRQLAAASVAFQGDRIKYFELGNEPNNYNSSLWWHNSTTEYVETWSNWTSQIDAAIETTASSKGIQFPRRKWWTASSTTDDTAVKLLPASIVPAGVDSNDQVAQYSIHSYQFATCDPDRAALATIPNLLNHTSLLDFATTKLGPSARAAIDSGVPWVVGEFNSVACSGAKNLSNTFAQALWTVDIELIYATLNASAAHLHQGATLVFQSDDQTNSAGADGSPGYSSYNFVWPRNSSQGEARALPGYLGLLFMAETISAPETRVRALKLPKEVTGDHFSAYAIYVGGQLSKLALLNLEPYYGNSTNDGAVLIDLSPLMTNHGLNGTARIKRMTAPSVDELATERATWAGQSFKGGVPVGSLEVEKPTAGNLVTIRGSEAVLVFFDSREVHGLEIDN